MEHERRDTNCDGDYGCLKYYFLYLSISITTFLNYFFDILTSVFLYMTPIRSYLN
jgi:hypothetical protein